MAERVPWLDYLAKHIGEKEIPGPQNNPLIVQWGKSAGIDWWNNDDDAWCAVAVNGALVAAGYPSTKSALARSFVNYGTRLSRPIRGAIVVFPRGKNPTYGHVGIVDSVNSDGTITVVNGNVSDMVKRSVFRTASILPNGIRWPPGAPMPGEDGVHLPADTGPRMLKSGARGEDVEDLQRDLNVLNYGLTVDGIFGPSTKNAVIAFQARRDLVADGIAGPATLSALEVAVAERTKTVAAKKTAEVVAKDSAKGAAVGGIGIAGGVTVAAQVADSFRGWAPTALAILVVAGLIAAGAYFGYRLLVKRAAEQVRNRDEEPEAIG